MTVDFDPVPIDRRGRRVDPVIVGVVVVVVALVVAIAKPWDSGSPAGLASASDRPIATPASPSPSVSPAGPTPNPTPIPALPPTWADLAEVVTTHDAWGVQAILSEGRVGTSPDAPAGYSDRWRPTTLDDQGIGSVVIERDERSMIVLGVTTPLKANAVDARVWRVHQGDRLEWVDTILVDPGDPDSSFLFIRPGRDGLPYLGWEPGTYRIDVLTVDGIRTIDAAIPGRFGDVPPPDAWTTAASGLVPANATDASAIRGGLFATVDGSTVPLAASETGRLSEETAWIDAARRSGSVVATAYLPRATGLGVMLGSGDDITGSSIERLAPDGPFDPLRPIQGLSDRQGRMLFVLFPAPEGAWEAGIYAITVAWKDEVGSHNGTWHVELLPGAG